MDKCAICGKEIGKKDYIRPISKRGFKMITKELEAQHDRYKIHPVIIGRDGYPVRSGNDE